MFVKIKVCILVVWDFFVMDWLSDLVDVFVEVRNLILKLIIYVWLFCLYNIFFEFLNMFLYEISLMRKF